MADLERESQIQLSDERAKSFLEEASKQGFVEGYTYEENGFMGPYYTYRLRNQNGAEMFVRYGGRMPFAVRASEKNLPLVERLLEGQLSSK